MRLNRSKLTRLAVAAISIIALSSPAFAQRKKATEDEPVPPYDVQGLTHYKVWAPWVFAFLFAAGCVAVGIKNPHRSHLD